jgi:NAD(P)H dehydrogenase (quinone)
MPVVVTGADRALGRAVVDALLAAGAAEVRATVRDRSVVAGLVAAGVRTAVSDLVDPLRFGAVLEGAHTVVHLDADAPQDSWQLLLEAVEDTGVRRLLTVVVGGTNQVSGWGEDAGSGEDAGRAAAPPGTGAYDVVVVRAASWAPDPAVVAALLAADRRREAPGFELVDLAGPG